MKSKQTILLILLATLLQSIALFLYPGHNHSNDDTLPFATGILFAFLICLLTRLRLRTIAFIVIISNVVALIIKIIVDFQFDPTSHNLFPFEIVITAVMACIAALIGIAAGSLAKRFRKHASGKG